MKGLPRRTLARAPQPRRVALRASVLGLTLVLAMPAVADDGRQPSAPAEPANAKAQADPSAQAAPGAPSGGPPRKSKSGYDDAGLIEGPKGVGNQLVDDDEVKESLVKFGLFGEGFYNLKRKLKDRHGIELNGDYNFLNQFASESETDRQASSGSIRFYGRWIPSRSKEAWAGKVVFRFENRHRIGPGIVPRDLGFDAGSALSTASFKAFGWGVTSLYLEKGFWGGRLAFVAGQMDPGDFQDLHPLLNAWTEFMSDASFNNPTVALPQQGLGAVGRVFFTPHLYLAGGVHDANGSPSRIDFDSFFNVGEYHTWAEAGWAPSPAGETAGQSVHVMAWHSEAREEAQEDEAWGATFSAAHTFGGRWTPFVRLGHSNGTAVSWGRPPEGEGPDQVTVEAFYRMLLTPNVQITPAITGPLSRPSATPSGSARCCGCGSCSERARGAGLLLQVVDLPHPVENLDEGDLQVSERALQGTVYAGLAVSSHQTGTLETAVYSELEFEQ